MPRKPHTQHDFTFIAVSYTEGARIDRFEKSNTFWAYYLEDGKLKKNQLLSLYPENVDDAIARFKKSLFDVIICKSFGPKAIAAFKAADIELYTFDGGARAAVNAYMRGELKPL